MSQWLQSGRRRDICILLSGAGELQGPALKAALSERYETRIDPQSFYGALEALVEQGFLERHAEGINEVYSLTDAGEARLREQYQWMGEQLDQ